MRKVAFQFLACLLVAGASAQVPSHFEPLSFPVVVDGKTLAYPFAGGLNNAQLSMADLNNDKIQDLVVFDRAGNAVLTFVNNLTSGTQAFRYTPGYAYFFPPCEEWMLLRDFDGDGAADIFCNSLAPGTQEIQVFKGYFENNILKFRPFRFHYPTCPACNPDLIFYPDEMPGFWNNLAVAETDLPDISDVDGDGDLDILTFEASVGGHVWWLENQSVERGFGRDSLQFILKDDCYGGFYESGLIACKNCLASAPGECCNGLLGGAEDRDGLHPGSTVASYDQNGDGVKELVLGDISFACLNMMTNSGSKEKAWMSAQDTFFPSYSTPVDLANFPAAFFLDLDGNGLLDLVASPNGKSIAEDINCVWYYPNEGTPTNAVFEMEAKNFLTRDMIDVGTTTHPAIADVDGDGLLDLVLGNFGYFKPGSSTNASLYLFLNEGSSNQPRFRLADRDWLGMSQFVPNDYDFAPAFGDLDGDGDLDLLVGSNGGWLYHFKNIGGAGQPMNLNYNSDPFWVTLDVGIASTPYIYDVDGDELLDMLIGERKGNVNFFKNTGSPTEAKFAALPDIEKFGDVDTKLFGDVVGYAAPVLVKTNTGASLLLTGAQHGGVEAYSYPGFTTDPFPLVSENWGNLDLGARSHPVLADLDADGKLDMLVGNQRGGLQLFRTELINAESNANGVGNPGDPLPVALAPNPASGSTRVKIPASSGLVRWRACNLLGQTIASGENVENAFDLDLTDWKSGIYVLTLEAGGRVGSVKLVVR